jgi:uncharacterized RDD family membrane protein YckC
MHCKHCGFANGEDDHRCLRCGRRIAGIVIAAPPGYVGANALAPAFIVSDDTAEFPPVQAHAPAQPALFSNVVVGANVIPFDRHVKQPQSRASTPQPPSVPPGQPLTPARKTAAPSAKTRQPAGTRGSLDFIPASTQKGRKLKTNVEAQVFCDQPVATPTHRLVASAIDGAIILLGFGLILGLFEAMGGSFGGGRILWIGLAGVLALVSMFYGLIWAIAGTETAGMYLTDLQLITFDGFQLDPRSRALRFASTWLSFCSGGLGLLWAVADEENLTWHDHISKTFPTVREVSGTFVKQRG